MRVSRAQAAENRERVVAAASRLLRERGIDGVGVDALMQAAGLTHGGFYKSFASKEALVAEACARAINESAATRSAGPDVAASERLRVFVESYLSPAHCAAAGSGCAFAALATDAGRRDGALRQVFTEGLAKSVGLLAELLPGRAAKRRERALATMAALVGAVILARATDDEAMQAQLLSATAGLILDGSSAAR